MKLWTIQPLDVWATLRSAGIWRARQPFVSSDWPAAYQWMAGQMEYRLGCRTLDDQMPVWVWSQWNGTRRPKPDLRSRSSRWHPAAGVRIELEVCEDRVLLSDHDLWHYVLNYWYLASSAADGRQFDSELKKAGLCYYTSKPLPDLERHQRIERSWQRIFDLGWSNRGFTKKRVDKSVQGVVWELRLSDVHVVTEFSARVSKSRGW